MSAFESQPNNKEQLPEKQQEDQLEKQPFKVFQGETVLVKRSDGSIENDWMVSETPFPEEEFIKVYKQNPENPEETLIKGISRSDLEAMNGSEIDFNQAEDLDSLMKLIEKQGTLTGSQQEYSAETLKEIIGKVESGELETTMITRAGGLRGAFENIKSKREHLDFNSQKISLEKSFGTFNSIREKNGVFEVILPGLIDQERKLTVGGSIYRFKDWISARDYYLKYMESREAIKTNPVLEMQIENNQKIAFSNLAEYNPILAPKNECREFPDQLKELLQGKLSRGMHTYEKTISKDGWDKEIFSFIQEYLDSEEGLSLKEKVGFNDLDLLTPKQALDLTSDIVVSFTKYNYSETETHPYNQTPSDQKTTIELLREYQNNQENPEWEGNGVCRNFASMTKAIFESLKENQTEFNFLRDTYCLYTAGDNYDQLFQNKENRVRMSGHAWNTFITIGEKDANSVVIDTTWANRNLQTKEIENIDYTLDRTNDIATNIFKNLSEKENLKEEDISNFLNYQEKLLKREGVDKEIVCRNLVKTLKHLETQPQLPKEIVMGLINTYGYSENLKNTDPSEIESLHKISSTNNIGFDFFLDNYLRNKSFSGYRIRQFIFKDDDLQKKVYKKIKNHPKFDEVYNSSYEFKSRIEKLII